MGKTGNIGIITIPDLRVLPSIFASDYNTYLHLARNLRNFIHTRLPWVKLEILTTLSGRFMVVWLHRLTTRYPDLRSGIFSFSPVA
jgi:hypothetical protein